MYFEQVILIFTEVWPDPKLSKPFYFNKISNALAEL